ncbi:hypothetical protein M9H77_25734 [Catharanthus roseus]|uniref:Uncharacterized protein n=1 Tax=Catharanthus roseus TaxID=4058 RepID=A0ACC0ABR2_CATRO|nr:hypothetical protein M9H77_25734 [Catharanthus roseus]
MQTMWVKVHKVAPQKYACQSPPGGRHCSIAGSIERRGLHIQTSYSFLFIMKRYQSHPLEHQWQNIRARRVGTPDVVESCSTEVLDELSLSMIEAMSLVFKEVSDQRSQPQLVHYRGHFIIVLCSWDRSILGHCGGTHFPTVIEACSVTTGDVWMQRIGRLDTFNCSISIDSCSSSPCFSLSTSNGLLALALASEGESPKYKEQIPSHWASMHTLPPMVGQGLPFIIRSLLLMPLFDPRHLPTMVEQKMENLTTTSSSKNNQMVMFYDFCNGVHPNHECPSMEGPMEQDDFVQGNQPGNFPKTGKKTKPKDKGKHLFPNIKAIVMKWVPVRCIEEKKPKKYLDFHDLGVQPTARGRFTTVFSFSGQKPTMDGKSRPTGYGRVLLRLRTRQTKYGSFWQRRIELWERNITGFRSIKKTTQIGIEASSSQPDDDECEDYESYDLSAEDAPPIVSTNEFQTEMWAAL